MGEKKPKQRGKPEWAAALLWLSPPCPGPSLDCGASGKEQISPAEGLGRAHRAWRPRSQAGSGPEVKRVECKMTLSQRGRPVDVVGVW